MYVPKIAKKASIFLVISVRPPRKTQLLLKQNLIKFDI